VADPCPSPTIYPSLEDDVGNAEILEGNAITEGDNIEERLHLALINQYSVIPVSLRETLHITLASYYRNSVAKIMLGTISVVTVLGIRAGPPSTS
jgi:hypothetical protein